MWILKEKEEVRGGAMKVWQRRRDSSSYVGDVVRQLSKENLEEVEPVTCCAAATRKAAARGSHCHQTDQTNLLEMS